ncbi:MAG: SocA family protein [Sphingomonadales bacterium]|nr:SocA family protein [Sphingomonadales bacterium]
MGEVKLHKVLYFSDMLHFLDTGCPLTGESYYKNKFGPTSRHLRPTLTAMVDAGHLSESTVEHFGYPKKQFQSLTKPDVSRLSSAEIATISMVTDFVCKKHTARSISDLSHNRAWQLAEMGEEIPYYTAFQMIPVEPTDEDFAWATDEAQKIADQRPPTEAF